MKKYNVLRVGSKCNQNCQFCYIKKDQEKDLSFNDSIKQIKKLYNESSHSICLTGGEITLRKDFLKLIKYCKKIGFKDILIQSNCTLFSYKKFTKLCKDAGLKHVIASFHSHNQKISNYLTQTKNHSKIIEGIKNLKDEDMNIIFNIVVNKYNIDSIIKTVKFINNMMNKRKFKIIISALRIEDERLKKYAIKNEKIKNEIKQVLKYCSQTKIDIMLNGFPLCFLKKANHISYGLKQHINMINYRNELWSLKKITPKNYRNFFKICNMCSVKSFCEGFDKKYCEIYDCKNECKPITISKREITQIAKSKGKNIFYEL